jgi:hypothetical protein
MSEKCPICAEPLGTDPVDGTSDLALYSCDKCGRYLMSRTTRIRLEPELFKKPEALFKIRRAIKLASLQDETLELSKGNIKAILARPLPSIRQQKDNLVRLIGKKSKGPGSQVKLDRAQDSIEIGATSIDGFLWIMDYLLGIQLVDKAKVAGCFVLTFKGWEHFEDLKRGGRTYNQAFMAMKYGDQFLDAVVTNIFKPAVAEAGFDLIRLDESPKAGLIDDQMRVEIQSSDFLIADLTHDNLGAYWEAGYAEGLGKPVIYTCEKGKFMKTETHFDTNHHLTVVWDRDAPQDAGEQLKATIRATLPGVAVMSDRKS